MTPQQEKELLLRVVTKLAVKQLAAGGFLPFAATLGSKRDVQVLMPKSMRKDVTADDLEAYWIRELKQAVAKGNCRTVCSCADVRVHGEGKLLVPAIFIHLEHAEATSEDLLYHYRKELSSGIILGEPAVEIVEFKVFTKSGCSSQVQPNSNS